MQQTDLHLDKRKTRTFLSRRKEKKEKKYAEALSAIYILAYVYKYTIGNKRNIWH